MSIKKKLFIVGDSLFAEIAFYYFKREDIYDFLGFVVDDEYKSKEFKLGFPVYSFSSFVKLIESKHKNKNLYFFSAITYKDLNLLREKFYIKLKNIGLKPTSYISKDAFVDDSVKLGEHNFIFESNTIQYGVEIGDNNIIWSGNHIGHHSLIRNNNFVSSHCVISGNVNILDNNFIGVNSTISNDINIGSRNFIGSSTNISSNVDNDNLIYTNFNNTVKKKANKLIKKIL